METPADAVPEAQAQIAGAASERDRITHGKPSESELAASQLSSSPSLLPTPQVP